MKVVHRSRRVSVIQSTPRIGAKRLFGVRLNWVPILGQIPENQGKKSINNCGFKEYRFFEWIFRDIDEDCGIEHKTAGMSQKVRDRCQRQRICLSLSMSLSLTTSQKTEEMTKIDTVHSV